MRKFGFPEILIGALLTVAVFAIGYSVSSARNLPGENASQHDQKEISGLVDVGVAVWDYVTKDAITLFTLVLAVATWLLWRSTDKLWQEARDGGETTSELARIADRQLGIQEMQTDLLRKQHSLSRLAFFGDHRPLLKVRFVRKLDGATPSIEFVVVNAGTTRANIRGSSATAAYMHLDDVPSVHDSGRYPTNNPVGRTFMDPGNGDRCVVPILNAHAPSHPVLRLYGFIVYAEEREWVDNDGNIAANGRTTYFMREFSPASQRFEPVPDPDYNAED